MKLQSASLEGLEPTLIRNLTDHHGNNLLHTVCYHGHVNLLPWVTRRFANELGGALSDENRRGFTPIVYAIKVRVRAKSENGCVGGAKGYSRLHFTGFLSLLRAKLPDWAVRPIHFSTNSISSQIGNEECVQWLVRNTSSGRDKLNSKEADRQRSLLHTASKYGQVRIQGYTKLCSARPPC